MRELKTIGLAVAVSAMIAVPVAAQSDFGADERFDSEFYGDLRGASSEPSYNTRANPDSGPAAATSSADAAVQREKSTSIVQTAGVPKEYMPWSGYWYPRQQADLAFKSYEGGQSPLEKYDSIVASLYGKLPGAAAWEADPVHNHNYGVNAEKIDWGGHCNGLAAAGILMPEPKKAFSIPLGSKPVKVKLTATSNRTAREYMFSDSAGDYKLLPNPSNSVKLTIADIKGLLAEAYMTCNTQQFYNQKILGTRYDNATVNTSSDAFKDIHPHYFHWLLQEFIKKNGMAFVAEIDAHKAVNNHPLFKYETNAVYKPAQKRYSVTTKCYFTHYAKDPNFVGTNVTTRTYTYDLIQDASGRVVRGEWTGKSVKDHPDFCWIPTSDAPPYATYENGAVHGDFIRYLFQQYGM